MYDKQVGIRKEAVMPYLNILSKHLPGDTKKNHEKSVMIVVGLEVLTAVVMKSSIFWDIKPCSLLKFNRHFRGICSLHLQGGRISQARNQH
jgi:hypothetical protein